MAAIRLVLSGGSAKGLLECAGAVSAVEDRGHTVVAGAGTSAGGIVMGALAAGRKPGEIRNVLLETDLSQFVDLGWRGWLRLALKGTASDGSVLLKFLRNFTRDRKLGESEFDVRITAADFSAGCPRVFTKDTDPDMELALAMRITSSLPLAFDAVEYEGRWYEDGGIYATVPVDAGVRDLGRMVIFAQAQPPEDCGITVPWKATPGLVKGIGRTLDLLIDANVHAQFEKAPADAITVFSDGLGHGTLEFDLSLEQKHDLYDHGYQLTAAALEAGGL